MTSIDKSKPVFVSGANGYVASWLVKKLLDEGLTVHAAVRDPGNEKKIGHLKEAAVSSSGKLLFFKGDLLEVGSYAEAMAGCELVFHTASPFLLTVKDPQKELIDPAVKGTENILHTASNTPGVKRVVVSSSCAAIYSDAIESVNAPGGMLTEQNWNTTASLEYQPYSLSKTMAEKKAWEIAKAQNQWDLIAINMSFVLGPPMNPHETTSESYNFIKQIGDGSLKNGIPKIGVGVVDVRDAADAHFKAGFTPSAQGRYITCGHNTDYLEMAKTLLPKYGDKFPISKSGVPKWLLMIIGPMIHKSLTWRFIRNNINIPWKADNSKIKNELGMEFRSLTETMNDSFQILIDHKILQPK